MMRRDKSKGLLAYTLMFLVCLTAYGCVLLVHQKLPIYSPDGFFQHFTVLGYLGKLARMLFRGEAIPWVSFQLGQGMDTLTTFAYYGLLDPLNLLSVPFSGNGVFVAYVLIDFVRAYLVGVCFMAYARKVGARDGWALACAAIVLVFCGFNIHNFARHTYFLNGEIYLFLLLLGVEAVLQDRRWTGYSLVVALMLWVNFYFAFMVTVATIVYILIRLAFRFRQRGVNGTARDGFLLLGGYLLGALLSAVFFLPIVKVFLGNARLGEAAGYADSWWHYRISYYASLVADAFTPGGSSGYWSLLNYAPVAFFALLCLVRRRERRSRQILLALLLCVAGLCVPLFGKLMNGNGYVTNRWCFILSGAMALGCAFALPDLTRSVPARRWLVVLLTLIYCAVSLAVKYLKGALRPAQFPGLILMVAFAFLYASGKLAALRPRSGRALIAGFLLLTTAVQCFGVFDASDQASELIGFDAAKVYANETVADQLDLADGERVSHLYSRDPHAILLGYNGTAFYWSMVSSTLGEYYRQLGLPTLFALDSVLDLGGSCELNAVAASRYYLLKDTYAAGIVPYGFEMGKTLNARGGMPFAVYENQYALPLGYAYEAALPVAEYEALPVERKLQALLTCAICDTDAVPRREAPDEAIELSWQATSEGDVTVADKQVHITPEASIRLDFTAPEDSETWLIVKGLGVADDAEFHVNSQWGTNYGRCRDRSNNMYFDRPVTALCLGGGAEALEGCTLSSRDETTYSFEDLRVVSLPLSAYRESVAARRAEALEEVAWGENRLSGRITVNGPRVLQIAVPYSPGWTACVDGREVPVLPCGGMYMGLPLNEGAHMIEMTYHTPGLRAGAWISLGALILLLALTLLPRLRAGRGRKPATKEAA